MNRPTIYDAQWKYDWELQRIKAPLLDARLDTLIQVVQSLNTLVQQLPCRYPTVMAKNRIASCLDLVKDNETSGVRPCPNCLAKRTATRILKEDYVTVKDGTSV